MPDLHAKLSASGSKRWMTCTMSTFEEAKHKAEQTSSDAEEGTLAHELGELILRYEHENYRGKAYQAKLKNIMKNEMYNTDMALHVKAYTDVCAEAFSSAKAVDPEAIIKIEQRLDFSHVVPEGFGTGDCCIIGDGTLEVIDLKFGKSPKGKVDATRNSQLMLYGLGALKEYDWLYDIHTVRMTIVQPRLDHIDSYEIDANELKWWGNQIVKPLAEKAIKGEGEYKPCEDACKFCKARATCKARADKNLELAQYEFRGGNDLNNDDISAILQIGGDLVNWYNEVKEYALHQALNGEIFEGWKVVEGRSSRKYTNVDEVEEILKAEGYEDIYKPQELLTITNMEKAIGKKKFAEVLDGKVVKAPGKPTLVVASDKREAYNPAKVDFS